MKYLLGFLYAICLVGVGHAHGVGASELAGSDGRLQRLVSGLVVERGLSGVVLVAVDGHTVVEQAFNVDPLRAEHEIKVDSAFAVASLTKSFTATLLLDQVASGKVDLDKPISAYLPGFDAAYVDSVTVRHLAQNRSGIPHYTDIPGWFDPQVKARFTAESFMARIAALELKFPPGADYYYSNVNYYLLGLILEAATGRSYESLLADRILNPLALQHTGQIYAANGTTVVPTYLRTGEQYERVRISNPRLFRAAASQYSTAQDLAAFGDAVTSGTLLNPQMRGLLLDAQHPMAFTVASVPVAGGNTEVVTYNGELAGTTSILAMFPAQRGAVVILSNNNTPYSSLAELALGIAQLVFLANEP